MGGVTLLKKKMAADVVSYDATVFGEACLSKEALWVACVYNDTRSVDILLNDNNINQKKVIPECLEWACRSNDVLKLLVHRSDCLIDDHITSLCMNNRTKESLQVILDKPDLYQETHKWICHDMLIIAYEWKEKSREILDLLESNEKFPKDVPICQLFRIACIIENKEMLERILSDKIWNPFDCEEGIWLESALQGILSYSKIEMMNILVEDPRFSIPKGITKQEILKVFPHLSDNPHFM